MPKSARRKYLILLVVLLQVKMSQYRVTPRRATVIFDRPS
jgi:hypothetical protein